MRTSFVSGVPQYGPRVSPLRYVALSHCVRAINREETREYVTYSMDGGKEVNTVFIAHIGRIQRYSGDLINLVQAYSGCLVELVPRIA